MKYRLIKTSDEVTVVTEDGGIACIREIDAIGETPRTATTDYYQSRITSLDNTDDLYEKLGDGKMFYVDWETAKFDSQEVLDDALAWLCTTETTWERDDSLFPDVVF